MAARCFIISVLCGLGPSEAFTNPSFLPRYYPRRPLRNVALQCSLDDTPLPDGSGGSSSDFSYSEFRREVDRRREQKQEADRGEIAFPIVGDRDAFMEEQMMLRKTLRKAYVLIYNQGGDQEGVYTLYAEGRNVLRAWEDKPEAARYALMLRAEELPLGKPTELPIPAIMEFCKENRVGLELVPRGRGLQPPSKNKPDFDWDGARKSDAGREPSSGRREGEESLFTPQELARIKSQFERAMGASGDEEP